MEKRNNLQSELTDFGIHSPLTPLGSTPASGTASFLIPTAYSKPSFLVGLVVGRIWTEYYKAYIQNKRRAALSLGDCFWRLSCEWRKASSDGDLLRAATRVRFKPIDLKKARASLAVVAMEADYDKLLGEIQRAFDRSASPAAKRLKLFRIFPKREHSEILGWDEESLSPSDIALKVVAEKYDCKPTTLRRLLSQAKTLSLEERLRRQWLQQFNVEDPAPPMKPEKFTDYFLFRLLPWVPRLKDTLQLPLSPIPSLLLHK